MHGHPDASQRPVQPNRTPTQRFRSLPRVWTTWQHTEAQGGGRTLRKATGIQVRPPVRARPREGHPRAASPTSTRCPALRTWPAWPSARPASWLHQDAVSRARVGGPPPLPGAPQLSLRTIFGGLIPAPQCVPSPTGGLVSHGLTRNWGAFESRRASNPDGGGDVGRWVHLWPCRDTVTRFNDSGCTNVGCRTRSNSTQSSLAPVAASPPAKHPSPPGSFQTQLSCRVGPAAPGPGGRPARAHISGWRGGGGRPRNIGGVAAARSASWGKRGLRSTPTRLAWMFPRTASGRTGRLLQALCGRG